MDDSSIVSSNTKSPTPSFEYRVIWASEHWRHGERGGRRRLQEREGGSGDLVGVCVESHAECDSMSAAHSCWVSALSVPQWRVAPTSVRTTVGAALTRTAGPRPQREGGGTQRGKAKGTTTHQRACTAIDRA